MAASLGVLLLHGFTGSPASIRSVEAPLRALGLPLALPLLRGHGAGSPEALRGVTWHDWLADGEAALRSLLQEAEQVIVLGHSMGGLVGLTLAADHPEAVDSLVLSATPILLASPLAPGRPLHRLTPLLQRLLPAWPIPKVYADPCQVATADCYPWTPMDALGSFLAFSSLTRSRLEEVRTPALILQSRGDGVVAAGSAEILLAGLGTAAADKRILWFERSKHELFRDCDQQAVIAAVLAFVRERIARRAGGD